MSDTLLEPEDQTGEHQVTKSGTCAIPGCPCRGWSAQETAGAKETTMTTEERIKQIPACIECGAVQFARYGHFPECSQFIADLDKVKSDSEHQPAARGGGEWTLSSEAMNAFVKGKLGGDGIPVFAIDVPDKEDRIHYAKIVVCGDQKLAQRIIDWSNQHQSLVAERERLRDTLRRLGGYAAAMEMTLNVEAEGEPLKEAWAILNE